MDEFTGIQTSLFLMLLLHFTGAAELIVRDGDETTLPCRIGIDGRDNCNSTTWLYSNSSSRPAVELTDGQTGEQAEDKSDRLSVSVTEQKDFDEVTLTCSVRTFGGCRHRAKWLFQGRDVDKDNRDVKTSQSGCSASVTFRTSHYIHTSTYKSFKCEVTDGDEVQQFPFRRRPSGEETITASESSPVHICENNKEAEAAELIVRDGDEVTLPCNSVMDDQNNCDSTTWLYRGSSRTSAVELVTDGQVGEQAENKSARLSVAENCSLVIKKITEEDDGLYGCSQTRSGQQGPAAVVLLSVVTITEQKDSDEVTLTCSVRINRGCLHTVKWLFQGRDVDKDNRDIKTSQSGCSASVTFRTSHYIHTSTYKSVTCEVTDGDEVQQFPFRRRPSGEETITARDNSTEAGNTTTVGDASTQPQSWWRFSVVSVGLAALIITVVGINVWTRIKEKKTQTDEITVRYDIHDGTVNYENITSPDGV